MVIIILFPGIQIVPMENLNRYITDSARNCVQCKYILDKEEVNFHAKEVVHDVVKLCKQAISKLMYNFIICISDDVKLYLGCDLFETRPD
jgi:hypothetical protein